MDDEKELEEHRQVIQIMESAQKSNLKKLDLSGKKITGVPKMFEFKLAYVQYLYLMKNNLSSLPPTFVRCFPNLQWLDLRLNVLHELPTDISLLNKLKNLLLEGNQIKKLPLQLGLLNNLTGLNIASNPIEFPPSTVIKLGTKSVLKFLKDQIAIEEKFDLLDFNHFNASGYDDDEEEADDYSSINEYTPDKRHDKRLILENPSLFTKINKIRTTTDRVKSHGKSTNSRLATSALVQKTNKKRIDNGCERTMRESVTKNFENRNQCFGNEHNDAQLKNMKKHRLKQLNEKAAELLQKQKNKEVLEEWQRKTRMLQVKAKTDEISRKHVMSVPYGNNCLEKPISTTRTNSKTDGELAKGIMLRELRDKKLEQKIKEHIKKIREWKHVAQTETVENEIKEAKCNLQEAIELQKALEEKRALEYRLRAFTGECGPEVKLVNP